MNTVCLLGSPRRGGNSDTLAMRFIERATDYDVSTTVFALSELNYSGCINLFECKKNLSHCGQTDGLTTVLDSIASAEVLVIASPIYFTNLTGQVKLAIDRFFSFFVPDYPTAPVKSRLTPGKHLVLLQTQGEPQDKYANVLDQYTASFQGLGFDNMHLVRAWGVREPDDVKTNEHFLQSCDKLAHGIYQER